VDHEKKIAIVGAGISGMTCAVALALRTDCLVHMYESDRLLLRKFWNAPFRYLHPDLNQWAATSPINEYDPHRRTLFPIMNWCGEYAPVVADQLVRQFRHFRHCLGIALRLEEPVFDVFFRNGRPTILLDSSSHLLTMSDLISSDRYSIENLVQTIRANRECDAIEYDAVIIATGFGEEKPPVDPNSGAPIAQDYSYWRSGNPDFYNITSRSEKSRPKRILISGNGESGVIELAHYLIHDFAHHRIFEFFPPPSLWGGFSQMVNDLRYREIELGNPECFGLAGPISWYWSRRASGSARSVSEVSTAVSTYEKNIYETIDSALAKKAVGAELRQDQIDAIEKGVNDDLDALASYEIEAGIGSIFSSEYYTREVVARNFRTEERELVVIGPTPTIYSRRQSPMTWYLVRKLQEFAGGAFRYEKGLLKAVTFIDGVTSAEVDTMKDSRQFDVVVPRQGPDFRQGFIQEFKREAAMSKYAVAGNPIPGDELRFMGGPFVIENENRSRTGYLYFLNTYFCNERWRQVINRGISLQDQQDSDEVDLIATRIHFGGNADDRARADKLFRRFKTADSRVSRRKAERSLKELDFAITSRRTKICSNLMSQDSSLTIAEAIKVAIEKVRAGGLPDCGSVPYS
jgi:hypothetical protein